MATRKKNAPKSVDGAETVEAPAETKPGTSINDCSFVMQPQIVIDELLHDVIAALASAAEANANAIALIAQLGKSDVPDNRTAIKIN